MALRAVGGLTWEADAVLCGSFPLCTGGGAFCEPRSPRVVWPSLVAVREGQGGCGSPYKASPGWARSLGTEALADPSPSRPFPGATLQSVICSNDALFYFVFFYPFPIFGILIITILLVRFKSRNSSKNSEGKNGVPLLWIKEPHLNYSPTCLEPPVLSIHPGAID